jgi:hypothetical protein
MTQLATAPPRWSTLGAGVGGRCVALREPVVSDHLPHGTAGSLPRVRLELLP